MTIKPSETNTAGTKRNQSAKHFEQHTLGSKRQHPYCVNEGLEGWGEGGGGGGGLFVLL